MKRNERTPESMRRTYFVDRVFQAKFMLGLVALSVFFTVAFGFALHSAVDEVIQESLYRSHQSSGDVWSQIWPTLFRMNLILASSSAGMFGVAVLVVAFWARHSLLIIGDEVRAIDGAVPITSSPVSLSLWSNDAEKARQRLQEHFSVFDEVAGNLESSAVTLASGKMDTTTEEATRRSRIELTRAIDLLDSTLGTFRGES